MIWLKELKDKWLAENAISALAMDDKYLVSFQKENDVVLPDDLMSYFKSLNGTGGDYTDDLYEFYSIN